MTTPDYNFDFLNEQGEENQEDQRYSYRIVNCCINCAYSYFKHNLFRCGWCGLGIRIPGKKFTVNMEEIETWPRTHGTCVCDKWVPRPDNLRLGMVTECTGVMFADDGSKVIE